MPSHTTPNTFSLSIALPCSNKQAAQNKLFIFQRIKEIII
jgi:hypothetical protein